MLQFIVLRLLETDESHGYDLMRQFEQSGWGRLAAGSLYPLLARLEQRGYIEGHDDHGRRTYTITETGRKRLGDVSEDLEDLEEELSAPATDSDLRGALERLSSSIIQSAGFAKAETVAQIVQRLDALRKEIYGLLASE
jgi:PadR family transcriptional regulator PadR